MRHDWSIIASAFLLALAAGIASAENVDLDLNPMNGAESTVTTNLVSSVPPFKIQNTITNNTPFGYSFDWPSAGPGGFRSGVTAGPGTGTEWEWTTFSTLYTIEAPVEFAPDPFGGGIPIFGFPTQGLGGLVGGRSFMVPGKALLGNPVTISASTLNSSFITFFSPEKTIATCNSTFTPGKAELVVESIEGGAIMATVEEIACCDSDDQTRCDDVCVSYLTDPNNCGGCGIVCEGESSCEFGCCSGTSNCNGSCSDFSSDPLNCGACGFACEAGTACVEGACEGLCPVGETDCGEGGCRNLQNDFDNCGSCGNQCDEGEECVEGECEASCFEGQTACGEVCADLDFDPFNCGTCGNECTEAENCYEGVCCSDCSCQPCAAGVPLSDQRAPAAASRDSLTAGRSSARTRSAGTREIPAARPAALRGSVRSRRPVSSPFLSLAPGRHVLSDTSSAPRPPMASLPVPPPVGGGVDCAVIDFEGLGDNVPIGTVAGVPNTIFGSTWLSLIDTDAGGSGNFANEPSPDTVAYFLEPEVSGPILTRNSPNASGNAAALAAWLADIGISEAQVEHTVDFEGFSNGQNISGVPGLFPGDLVITDTGPGTPEAIVRGSGFFGGSNPVGTLSLAHDEQAFLELDFSARPVDYVAFQDIDHAGTQVTVEFDDQSSTTTSLETTAFNGNSAEFFGIYRNGQPQISRVKLDASGDLQWGVDTIRYGRIPPDPIDFDAGVQFVEIFYTAASVSLPVTLTAWDGPGGTGNVVDATQGNTLGVSTEGAACAGDPVGEFCLWDSLQLVAPADTIRSVTLSGAASNQFGFDNMTFCTGVPPLGACCLGNQCRLVTSPECTLLGGTFTGDDVCAPDTCGPPSIVGITEEPLCTIEMDQQTIPAGGSATVFCTDGFRGGIEKITQVTIMGGDGQASGSGPCAVVVADTDLDISGFVPTPFEVRIFDTSRDFLLQPGEAATLELDVLNIGMEPLLGANPSTPPTVSLSVETSFFTPLPFTITNGSSGFTDDFPGLADEDLGGCAGQTPNLRPRTTADPLAFVVHAAQAGDVSRLFKFEIAGKDAAGGAVSATMPVAIGIGSRCDGTASTLPFDGVQGLTTLGAQLRPLTYDTVVSASSIAVGDDVLLDFVLTCDGSPADSDSFDPLPQLVGILDGDVEKPLPANTFFGCTAGSCSLTVDTTGLPTGTPLELIVKMPDSRTYKAGIQLSN